MRTTLLQSLRYLSILSPATKQAFQISVNQQELNGYAGSMIGFRAYREFSMPRVRDHVFESYNSQRHYRMPNVGTNIDVPSVDPNTDMLAQPEFAAYPHVRNSPCEHIANFLVDEDHILDNNVANNFDVEWVGHRLTDDYMKREVIKGLKAIDLILAPIKDKFGLKPFKPTGFGKYAQLVTRNNVREINTSAQLSDMDIMIGTKFSITQKVDDKRSFS